MKFEAVRELLPAETALHRTRPCFEALRFVLAGSWGLPCGLEPVLIGLKDSAADVPLHLFETNLFIREVGKSMSSQRSTS